MAKVKKIEIIPQDDPTQSTVKVTLIDDDSREVEVNALAGLTLVAITDMDFFSGYQGNVMFPFYALTEMMKDNKNLYYQLFFTALSAAIQTANLEELQNIFNVHSQIMDQIADRQATIGKPENVMAKVN